ncbi:retrovirus-related pol polyprotein from transposon 17.6 [Tanacetum coccineum]
MVRITNVQVMEQYNQLERRLSIQEKSFSDLQSSVSALNSTVLQLKKSIDEDLKAGLNVLIADYQSRMKLDTNPDSSFVTGGSPDRSYVEVMDDQSNSKVDVPPDVLLDLYLGGLPAEFLHTIHLFDPKTVNQAMRLARLQEGAYYALWGLDVPKSQSFHNDSSGYEKNRSSFSPSPSALPSPKFLPSVFPRGRYSPGHVCKNGKLYMILSLEFEDVGEVDASIGSESSYRDESTEGQDSLALSIHALLGSWGLQTLQRLGLKLIAIPTKIVSVANGLKIPIQFIIRSLKWCTNGVEFEADFFAMPIGGYDVVLGINWLSTLGEIKFDFKLLYMEFNWNDKVIRFNGRPKITHEWDKSTDLIDKGPSEQAYLINYATPDTQFCDVKLIVPTWMQNQPTLQFELQQLLDAFSDVFDSLTQLPPKRILDHSIKLTEGSNPVNLKAYRYGPLQKNVIENMVKEMLENSIIRESQSEFASPVVLVKKKDSKWRFCVDYRKLNNITVKNQFPIPIMEELLDELQGACLFSKLDLRSGYH